MKSCSKCGQEKSFTEFNRHSAKKDGYQSFCRICSQLNSQKYYNGNSDKYLNYNTKARKRCRDQYLEYKKSLSCSQCKMADFRCLDFHHSDPSKKSFNIGHMINQRYSWEAVKEEIDKCIVLCSNCHRILHYELDGPEVEF